MNRTDPIEIYQRELQAVYRIAYTYLQNREDAENTAQECFVRLLKSGFELDDAAAVKGWLMRMVTTLCLAVTNDRDRVVKDDPAPHEIDRCMAAIMKLPGKYKTVCYLAYNDGYGIDTIASLLCERRDIVNTIVIRTRQQLERDADLISQFEETVGASYEKIRIDPNAAVRIWKSVLMLFAAYEDEKKKRAAERVDSFDFRPSAMPVTPVVPRKAEEPDESDITEGEEYGADGGDVFRDKADRALTGAKTAAASFFRSAGAAIRKAADSTRQAAVEAAEKRQAEKERAAAPDEDGDVRVYRPGRHAAPQEPEYDDEPEYTAESEYDDEPGYDEDYEEEPVRRGRHSRHSASSGRGLSLPVIIIAAAVIVAIAVGFFFYSRSSGKKSEKMGGSVMPQAISTDFSVAVTTPPPVVFEGKSEELDKLTPVQTAMNEWKEYKRADRESYVAENLPSFAEFLKNDDFFDGVSVVENGDGTYSLVHFIYEDDWGNSSVDPVTGEEIPTIIQQFDYTGSVTVEENEYSAYLAYENALSSAGSYGDYNYSYGVSSETDAQKLEQIAAAGALTLRKGDGTGKGMGEASAAELEKSFYNDCGRHGIYTALPSIDYYSVYNSGAFTSQAKLPMKDGRRMSTLLCFTPYAEMIDALEANGITILDSAPMQRRSYTAADGTELTISCNDTQAIVYAYLDKGYVVMDMGISAWRDDPTEGDGAETLSAKRETDFSLSEELVNYAADFINYKNING